VRADDTIAIATQAPIAVNAALGPAALRAVSFNLMFDRLSMLEQLGRISAWAPGGRTEWRAQQAGPHLIGGALLLAVPFDKREGCSDRHPSGQVRSEAKTLLEKVKRAAWPKKIKQSDSLCGASQWLGLAA